MKELSLNILDISQNSITAGASLVEISLVEKEDGWLTLAVTDDGCGMSEETLRTVMDPFYTTRTTRKVGMGIPLLKLAAEQTGGEVTIESVSDKVSEDHGTVITATFDTKHIDMTPLGDVIETVVTILQGHPEIDYLFIHKTPRFCVEMDTREMRAVLGDVSLAEPEILEWVRGNLSEQYEQLPE
ncbi:MAG: ATP-binding protein [Clostridia bacterium]|nr:ATP-binding protein [Clostridia bacterium]